MVPQLGGILRASPPLVAFLLNAGLSVRKKRAGSQHKEHAQYDTHTSPPPPPPSLLFFSLIINSCDPELLFSPCCLHLNGQTVTVCVCVDTHFTRGDKHFIKCMTSSSRLANRVFM